MNDGLPAGPGRREEGPTATSGSSRLRGQIDDHPRGPGVAAQLTPEQRRARGRAEKLSGRPRPLYEHWNLTIRPALQGKWATEHVSRPVFLKNVAHLRERGLTDDQIRDLITLFSAEVKAARIVVDHKVPWFVFMRAWPKLGQGGTGTAIADDDDPESWTRLRPEV